MVGISQAIAILPGISRSGATISTAVLLGIDRTKAAINKYLKDNPAKLQTMVDKNITRHKGGAVMTENASSLADNIPKSSKLHSRYDSCVTTIKK